MPPRENASRITSLTFAIWPSLSTRRNLSNSRTGQWPKLNRENKFPIFCGGTGLYFKAFLEGIGEAPPADATLRAELEAMPLAQLLEELRERDPAAYETIDRKNPRRVIRAIEVIRTTGKPFSSQRSSWNAQPATGSKLLLFTRSAADLRRRIDVRVDEMFRRGLVEETRELLKHGLTDNKTAMQAIGYRQVVEYLRGDRTHARVLAQTIELVKIRTRQFAKRQLTWYRRHGNCQWIELQPEETVEEILRRLAHFFV